MDNRKNKKTILKQKYSNLQKNILFKRLFSSFLNFVSFVLLIGILVFLVYKSVKFFNKTSNFNVNNLLIKGNINLTYIEILDIIGIKKDDYFFKADLNFIKKRLERHPRIKKAKVYKQTPNKLVVEIEEREPFVLLNIESTVGNNLYELDKNGFIIGEYPYIKCYNLPVITGINVTNLIPGEKVNFPILNNILCVLREMNKKFYGFNNLIGEIHIKKENNQYEIISYLNIENKKVLFGRNFNSIKLIRLISLLKVIKDDIKNLKYINYKYEDIICKYIKEKF